MYTRLNLVNGPRIFSCIITEFVNFSKTEKQNLSSLIMGKGVTYNIVLNGGGLGKSYVVTIPIVCDVYDSVINVSYNLQNEVTD